MMLRDMLEALVSDGTIRPIDKAFAEFVCDLLSSEQVVVPMVAAYLSARLGAQDTCVPITQLQEQPFLPVYLFPDADEVERTLSASPVVTMISDETDKSAASPIVIEQGQLYLQRYYFYEQALATQINRRCQLSTNVDTALVKESLQRLFPDTGEAVDWQKVAVAMACVNPLMFITGGPGTGKTTTVTKLLAVLRQLAGEKSQTLRIQLVAPTGKAAARLVESMANASKRLPEPFSNMPDVNSTTIHQLLGSAPGKATVRMNASRPLPLDIVVVDEASMIDLPLMAKLFDALPMSARVIVLGDSEQLASVETGSVLSDICDAVRYHSGTPLYSESMLSSIEQMTGARIEQTSSSQTVMSDHLVVLQKSHRFSSESAVGNLASAIRLGQSGNISSILRSSDWPELHWSVQPTTDALVEKLLPHYLAYFEAVEHGDMDNIFEMLFTQQVLCATRGGEWGVNNINRLVEQRLIKSGVISQLQDYYPGRPVMVSQNDHVVKLYNGDVGIVLPDAENPELLKVWFPVASGEYRGVTTGRLPPHDTVYAMTIHKSQGSEFDQVFLCLPPTGGEASRINRELLYTGLTRAKSRFSVYASEKVLKQSVGQTCRRSSGLSWRID